MSLLTRKHKFSFSSSKRSQEQISCRRRRKSFKFLILHLNLVAGRYFLWPKRWFVEQSRGAGSSRHAKASEQPRGPPANDTATQGE